MNNLINLTHKYAEKRSLTKNANNGYAYIGCLIGNLKRQCVLFLWYKSIQY